MRFAWAQPSLGRIELSTIADFGLPGISQESGFTYSYTAGHLAAAHVFFVAQPMRLVITAVPRITANLAFGGSGAPDDVSGYVASLQLTVSAASSGDTTSSSATVGSVAGIGPAFFPAVQALRNQRFLMNAVVNADGPDVLLLSLSISAVVFQQAGSYGLALVDMDGMTSPPGPGSYFPNGGLVLPSFLVSDANCPPIIFPSIDPTV
jgi:hypothetical protein